MDLTPSDRAKMVVRYLSQKEGITQAQIGQRIGYSNRSSFSAVLSGLKPLPARFGEKLASLDPEINPEFLSGESNDMLRDMAPIPPPGKLSGIYLPLELVRMFTNMSETILSQQEELRELRSCKKGSAMGGQ